MKTEFYICEHCGNTVQMIENVGAPLMCCGDKMKILEAGAADASREKHVPAVTYEDGTVSVCVGTVTHPMSEEHSIAWIYLETDRGGHMRRLSPTERPEAKFTLVDECPVAAYAYCNLHGLWCTEL